MLQSWERSHAFDGPITPIGLPIRPLSGQHLPFGEANLPGAQVS